MWIGCTSVSTSIRSIPASLRYGNPKLGGSREGSHLAMEMLAATNKVSSLELVEVNPTLDHRNTTAEVAVELIASALGQSIL